MKKSQIKYLIMQHLGIRVSTFCNLNCKDCADLVPYIESSHYDYDLLIQDFGKVLQTIDVIREVLIIGGEVFLYPYMYEVLEYCINHPKINKVIITTNGTMMPSEKMLRLLQHGKVTVRISGYGESIVPQRPELIRLLAESKVQAEDLEGMLWSDVGNAEYRHRNVEELKTLWMKCGMNACVTLASNGKIYYCSRSMTADELDIYPAPEEGEFVDVRNTPVEQLGEKLERFYDLEYISTCNYCDGITDQSPLVPTAAQIVPKNIALELLLCEYRLRNGENSDEIVSRWLELMEEDGELLMYESRLPKAVEITLNYVQHTNGVQIENVLSIWNALNNDIFSSYNFYVEMSKPYFSQTAIRGKRDLKKNTIYIYVSDEEGEAAGERHEPDITVTPEEIKCEAELARKTKYQSVFRYAFVFENII